LMSLMALMMFCTTSTILPVSQPGTARSWPNSGRVILRRCLPCAERRVAPR
jgi:hypothetical protein